MLPDLRAGRNRWIECLTLLAFTCAGQRATCDPIITISKQGYRVGKCENLFHRPASALTPREKWRGKPSRSRRPSKARIRTRRAE